MRGLFHLFPNLLVGASAIVGDPESSNNAHGSSVAELMHLRYADSDIAVVSLGSSPSFGSPVIASDRRLVENLNVVDLTVLARISPPREP